QFPEITVGKEAMQALELLVGQNAANGNLLQGLGDDRAGAFVEEPKSRHSGIVNDGIIFLHLNRQRIQARFEIEHLVAIGHAVVAEDIEPHIEIMLLRNCEQLVEPLFVESELGTNFGRTIADPVQESVEFGPIDKSEVDALGLNGRGYSREIFAFFASRIADVIGNIAQLEKVKDI